MEPLADNTSSTNTTVSHGGGIPVEIQQIVEEELSRSKERIVARIKDCRELTDREVYEAGVAVNEIVLKTRSYLAEVNETLTSTQDSSSAVEEVLDHIVSSISAQDRSVSKAMEQLAGIARAGRAIQEASGASRLLALNARVESARFGGEGGRAFNVIADEMRQLSVAVESTNTMVAELVEELQRSLPSVAEEGTTIRNRVESLVDQLEVRNGELQNAFSASIDMGNDALQKVLSKAQDALSHLQFQDKMIQDLEGIERIVDKTSRRICDALAVDMGGGDESNFLGTLGAELDDEEEVEPGLDAGEILLF